MKLDIKMTHNRGRGVFASEDIKAGEVIEECPVIVIPEEDTQHLDKTRLTEYWFSWKADDLREYGAITLGYGSLYNHSKDHNAVAERDYQNRQMKIRAVKDIPKGKEITIEYMTVWFEERAE